MGWLTPVAVRIGAISWMPKLLPQITWTDRQLQRATAGRLSILDLAGLPNLMMTVPGRKTGVPRSVPLLCVPRGDSYLVAGSYFGSPKEPVWVANLQAALAGELTFAGRTTAFRARPLTGTERAAAWRVMVGTWPNFALYEKRTDREIKVFELTPEPVSQPPPVVRSR